MTVNEFISQVRNALNVVNLDDYIPAKYIHRKGLQVAKLFMKREGEDRRIYQYPDIWVTVDDFRMKESSLIGCSDIDVPDCTKVMKSVLKLPEVFTTRYGYLMNISSIDNSTNYIQKTPREYAQLQNRRYKNPRDRYFWIYNNYVIVPDASVETLVLRAIFPNKADGLKLNACDDCGCIKVLDQTFPVPVHLEEDVVNATVQRILTRKQIPADQFPNMDDEEKKSPLSK